ncbi:MAG TPA: hypothetical protein VI485_07665 [Vicinamibacterales bacterium]|nr:hypothetical protein [Vicinamibacterales bacterium]
MRAVLCGVSLALCAACGNVSEPPFKPAATVDQLMIGPVQRSAQFYWDSVSTIIDSNGITERSPKTDQEWAAVWSSAITIAESGNLLMMPSRAKDQNEWMTLSAALVDAGMEAAKAAESRNPEAVLGAGETVYNVCTQCHNRYISQD